MADKRLLTALERLGLTAIESLVYLALLENGQQQAGNITKLTGVHRRTVYDAIARLVEKGLVAYIKTNHTRIYEATHPERLADIVKEQEQQISSCMPDLEKLYEHQPSRHETVFFRGKHGLKALFDDQLQQERSTVQVLGATPAAVDQLRYYFPQFDRQRVRKGIKVQLLFDQRVAGKSYVRRIPLAQARRITVDDPQDVVTCIYGDTIALVHFSEKPFGVMIRGPAVAQQYRNWFSLLWKDGKAI
jgi:sugar-specific transcriptional regulator TrmB